MRVCDSAGEGAYLRCVLQQILINTKSCRDATLYAGSYKGKVLYLTPTTSTDT